MRTYTVEHFEINHTIKTVDANSFMDAIEKTYGELGDYIPSKYSNEKRFIVLKPGHHEVWFNVTVEE